MKNLLLSKAKRKNLPVFCSLCLESNCALSNKGIRMSYSISFKFLKTVFSYYHFFLEKLKHKTNCFLG